ncbi:MAG TPA: ABC-F family ATP-binding cassette domain-containing protein [Stellaceae bacterium]
MLTISNLTYRIAGRTLIENASAQIVPGQRVGLVGRNGAGKSTLLDLIRGTLQPDGGDIVRQRDARLGFVAQEAPAGDATPLETVLAADEERAALLAEAETATAPDRIAEIQMRLVDIDAHAAPARAATILAGLGFDHEAQQRPMSSFSGGWRVRVALAAALFAEPDLLLLDEPTNHLDLEAALWLEAYLKAYRYALIVVSHDRQILNGVCTHILHLHERRLTLYRGGYDDYVRLRREAAERSQALAARQEAERARLQAFIDRFRAKATKARQAQSRVKALARLEPIAVATAEESGVRFAFPSPPPLDPPVLTFDGVSVGYEPGRPVLRNINLRLDPDDRIALLGANGNGKSTLAKLIAGRLRPLDGRETRASKLTSGFFAQHQVEELEPDRTPYEHLAALMPQAGETTVRTRLGGFGFGQDKAFVPVRDLSGGEKARLNFALISQAAPSLLILDEPTNHLDIEAREALVAAINEFAGAVLLISHDWHLLELTVDRLWLVAGGGVRPFDGDLEDYRRHLLEERSAATAPAGGASRAAGDASPSRRDERRAAAERRKELEPLRRQAREAEKRIARLTEERRRLDAAIADPATYADGGGNDIAGLLRRQADLNRQIEAAEAEWLSAEAAIEGAMAAGA